MPRTELPIIVLDPITSLPVSGASCIVLDRQSGSSAPVYSTETAPSPISQPVITDSSGRLSGWVNRGRYEVQITVSGRPTYSDYYDSSPAQDGGIDTGWIADSSVTTAKIADSNITTVKLGSNAVTTAKLGLKSVDSTILANDASVDASRAVSTNHIKDAAVTGAKIAAGSVGPSHLTANVLPIGTIVDWWRWSTAVSVPSGWAICDGTPWASISNDMGLVGGTIPNLINAFTIGARLTTTSGGSTPADGAASTNGNAYANAPGIGGVGGSNAVYNLGHSHNYSHTHGVAGVDHLHAIALDGYHDHSTGLATRGSPNGYSAGGGESVAFTNHQHYVNPNGSHSHGGATGASDRSLNTSTNSQNTSTTGITTWNSGATDNVALDMRPKHIGMLKIMKVKNS